MKKILGIMGSPRRNGNTHILLSRILEGAESERAKGDILFLDELLIQECNGCHTCWEGKNCSKDDDMNSIYPKIIESDVIVFGTPVYWYGPTALMKLFIDRFVYFNCPDNREKIRGKPVALAIPFEEEDPQTAALLEAFFEKSLGYLEMDLVGTILVPGVTRKGEIREKEAKLQEAYALGKKLARLLRK